MLDSDLALLGCRNLADTVSVCTTGSLALAATTSGYTRGSGSFITDGFKPGMEITPAGFASNTKRIVKEVAALTLTVDATLTVEASSSGRSISVLQPEYRAYPNIKYDPAQASGRPYTEEEFLPGPSFVQSVGPFSTIVHEPTYVHKYYGLAGKGSSDAHAYAKAVLALFAPRTSITLSDGTVLRVKANPAPYSSQITNPSLTPGRALVTVTIPLWAQTTNSI